jgi:hypothetical protein
MQSHTPTQNQTSQDPTARREGENLVKLSARTNVRAVIRYIVDLFKVKNYDTVHISGLNFAISNVILVTEVVKTQVLGLHQVNNIDCVEMDSRDQSSGEVQVIRRTPKFEVILSRAEPKSKTFGYQRPLSQEEVKTILSVQGMDSSEGAERGRGGRGRGRGRGRGGRGRGGRGRGGRGRGGRGGYERSGSRSGSFDESRGGRGRGGRGGYERGGRGRGGDRGGRGGYEGGRGGYEGGRGGYEGGRGGYERGGRGGYERGSRGGYERGSRGGYERGSRGGDRGGRGNFQNSSETTPQQVNVRTGTVGLKK